MTKMATVWFSKGVPLEKKAEEKGQINAIIHLSYTIR